MPRRVDVESPGRLLSAEWGWPDPSGCCLETLRPNTGSLDLVVPGTPLRKRPECSPEGRDPRSLRGPSLEGHREKPPQLLPTREWTSHRLPLQRGSLW